MSKVKLLVGVKYSLRVLRTALILSVFGFIEQNIISSILASMR